MMSVAFFLSKKFQKKISILRDDNEEGAEVLERNEEERRG
jgi:hypothetical protein